MWWWQWLIYVGFTVLAFWFFVALLFNLAPTLGWTLIEEIPEGHPDQFDQMDMRERGLR